MASTEQAASAENLRNHTPSLENLVARSRIREDLPLSACVQHLLPESIAESRVEDFGNSPDMMDTTAAPHLDSEETAEDFEAKV